MTLTDPTDNPTRHPYSGQIRKIIILAEAQGWRCAYCPQVMAYPSGAPTQTRDQATIDHVRPRIAGGMPVWENEVAACSACNTAKGHYSALLFWLLMQTSRFNRRWSRKQMDSMTSRTRSRLMKRLIPHHMPRDCIIARQTDGPQTEGIPPGVRPPPQRVLPGSENVRGHCARPSVSTG